MKIFLLFLIIVLSFTAGAQNMGVGTRTPKSKLHVAGDLRVDSLAKDSGVVFHDQNGVLRSLQFTGKKTDFLRGDGSFQSLDAVAATSTTWLTAGNSGVDTAINFLGTTDNKPLLFRVNNKRSGILDPQRGNVGLGVKSLFSIKTGKNNVALGTGALENNITGSNSIAIGDSALYSQDSASSASITGPYVIESIAIGSKALFYNYGRSNTAIGINAVMENSISSWNTAVGYQSLMHNSTFMANYNTAIGVYSMFNNGSDFTYPNGPTYGSNNVAVGAYSMYGNVRGNFNVAVGMNALNKSDGSENTAVGYAAMSNGVSGGQNTAIGFYALLSSRGWYNTGMGYMVLRNNTTGSNNTVIGTHAMYGNTTGDFNSSFGRSSSGANTSGSFNSAFGEHALASNISGNYNTAIGSESLYYNGSSGQTAVGYQAMFSNTTGVTNSALGYKSLYSNTTGSANVATGYQALLSNTVGASNVAIGMQALVNNTTGVSNTAIGTKAIGTTSSGVNNTAIGYGALLTLTTGFQNTAVGMYADVTSGNFYNATAIGYNAKVNASNKVRIGNAAVTKIEGQVPFSTPSDGRYKFNVREDVQGLNFIMKLRPVTYQFDVTRLDKITAADNISNISYNKAAAIRRTGFIAQEVEKAAELSHYDFSGINKPESDQDHYSLSYEAFVVPLVKGMQQQQVMIDKLQQLNQELSNKIEYLEAEINLIKSKSKLQPCEKN